MRSCCLVFFLPLLLLLAAAAAAPPRLGNLLNANGGFEEGTAHWYLSQPNHVKIDTAIAYRGFASLCMFSPKNSKSVGNNLVVQGVAIPGGPAGRSFLFSVAVRARHVNPAAPPHVAIMGSRGKGRRDYWFPESRRLTVRSDTNWKILQVKITAIPRGIKAFGIRLIVPHHSGETVWFDDVQLREVLK